MYEKNAIVHKSKDFAVRIINLNKYLNSQHKEYVLSKQILRSGTSIGANVKESLRGQSRADFYSKMNIALKEASETEYWLELLYETGYLDSMAYKSINKACQELLKLLVSIVKSKSRYQS